MASNNATTAAPAAPASTAPGNAPDAQDCNASSSSNNNANRGSRSSRSRGGGVPGRRQKNMGRKDYNRLKDENNRASKRVKTDREWKPLEGVDEAEKEERKPKRKVAVMISYCGSGYKGMQLNPPHKSIEGDLFEAFVKAGAISRANSNDPKKSSLVRCARTDKGVHAAGNVISLKLIIEDPEVVPNINANLPDQIRVWDIIRTTGSFSSYQLCDSRKYEYLLPSHVFLPPHPKSFLARKCMEYAERERDLEGFLERQKEVAGWWPAVEEKVNQLLAGEDKTVIDRVIDEDSKTEEPWKEAVEEAKNGGEKGDALLRKIRDIHNQEKRAYRISPAQLERVREAFLQFVGTNNYYNFTIEKTFKDPSAKRHIKSFEVSDPIIINGTEWLSIHVHGQSFMMHQIRKMVGMAMMVVRTGCPVTRIQEAFGPRKISIGKAPALGLLLEYPVFDHYNTKTCKENNRDPLDFEKYREDIDKFKDKFIYSKIFDQEEKENTFSGFVQYMDAYNNPAYLYLTSAGFKALDEAASSGNKAPEPEEQGNESEEEVMGGTEEG